MAQERVAIDKLDVYLQKKQRLTALIEVRLLAEGLDQSLIKRGVDAGFDGLDQVKPQQGLPNTEELHRGRPVHRVGRPRRLTFRRFRRAGIFLRLA